MIGEKIKEIKEGKLIFPSPLFAIPPIWAEMERNYGVRNATANFGGGGVIWDCQGAWIRGFSRSIGFASGVQAELKALLDGLLMTIELDIQYLRLK